MIVCASIKFKIEKTNQETILCGVRHRDCFSQLSELGFEPKKGYEEIEQGFMTHDNRFLTREEAIAHAVTIGQVNKRVRDRYYEKKQTELFSEDLW